MVPLDSSGRIHEAELRRYVDWLIQQGVHGLYPNGSTGEFVRFNPEERRQIVKIVCEQAGGRVPVLAAPPRRTPAKRSRPVKRTSGSERAAVAICFPFYYRLSPESVYAYFREIAFEQSDRCYALQHSHVCQPHRRANDSQAGRTGKGGWHQRFLGGPGFHDAHDRGHPPLPPEFSFLTGWEAVLVPMIMVGADGGTHATSGVVPELTRQMFELARARQFEPAMALQYRLLELFDAMLYSADFPEGSEPQSSCAVLTWAGVGSRSAQLNRLIAINCKRCSAAFWRTLDMSRRRRRVALRAAMTSKPLRVKRIADDVLSELRKKGLV
jgi:4-hydroxy-tetrahydrodipicolinate synthase